MPTPEHNIITRLRARLSDTQLNDVILATRPLLPRARMAFLTELSDVISNSSELDDGSLHRAVRLVQQNSLTLHSRAS